ncbi:MAG: PDZ domain-containing protein [Planctomycetota bacterium]
MNTEPTPQAEPASTPPADDTVAPSSAAEAAVAWAAWWRRVGISVLGGAFSGLLMMGTFHPLAIWPLGWIAFVPWLLVLPESGRWGTVLSAAAVICIWFGACCGWLANLDPEVGSLILGVILAVLSLQLAVVGFIWRSVLRRPGGLALPGAAVIVATFVTLEYLKAVANIPLPFSWLQVAASQVEFAPFIQVADLGGGWLVAAAMVAFNVAIVMSWHNVVRARRAAAVTLSVVPVLRGLRPLFVMLAVIAAGCIYGAIRSSSVDAATTAGPKIAMVQPNFIYNPGHGRMTDLDVLVEATMAAAAEKPDIIAWPEAALFGLSQNGVPEIDLAVDSALIVTGARPGPASDAGVQVGDRILKVGDVAIASPRDMENQIAIQAGEGATPISLTIEHAGAVRNVTCIPRRVSRGLRAEIDSPNPYRRDDRQLVNLVDALRLRQRATTPTPDDLLPGWPYMLVGTSFLIDEFHPSMPEEQYDQDCAHFIEPPPALDAPARLQGHYVKRALVPAGEFMPYVDTLPFIAPIVKQAMGAVPCVKPGTTAHLFTVDTSRTPWSGSPPRPYLFAAPICYEVAFSPVIRSCVAGPAGAPRPADFMLNISDDCWYQQSAELDQMLMMARLRCIENRRGMARCTNTGISGFISPTGQVKRVLADSQGRVKEIGPAVLTDRVDVTDAFSLYTATGDWVPWLALLILAAAAVQATRKRLARRADPSA